VVLSPRLIIFHIAIVNIEERFERPVLERKESERVIKLKRKMRRLEIGREVRRWL
jgi:hypothetical protein